MHPTQGMRNAVQKSKFRLDAREVLIAKIREKMRPQTVMTNEKIGESISELNKGVEGRVGP